MAIGRGWQLSGCCCSSLSVLRYSVKPNNLVLLLQRTKTRISLMTSNKFGAPGKEVGQPDFQPLLYPLMFCSLLSTSIRSRRGGYIRETPGLGIRRM